MFKGFYNMCVKNLGIKLFVVEKIVNIIKIGG